jgi:hypothetical protein
MPTLAEEAAPVDVATFRRHPGYAGLRRFHPRVGQTRKGRHLNDAPVWVALHGAGECIATVIRVSGPLLFRKRKDLRRYVPNFAYRCHS